MSGGRVSLSEVGYVFEPWAAGGNEEHDIDGREALVAGNGRRVGFEGNGKATGLDISGELWAGSGEIVE